MNADRRKRVKEIAERFVALRSELEVLRDEEQEAYENLPENFQDNERGQAMSDAAEELSSIVDDCEALEGRLEELLQ